MVKEYNWTKINELTIADDKTMFKLSCRHEPHSLVVLTPGRVTNMITVQCTETQTIHDLMRKHGLHCSDVWNSAVYLSARSPCTALRDHMMNIVYVNRIPRGPSVNCTPEISTFYHNMNHIKVRARRKALRYNPYGLHFQSSGATISSKESDPTEDLITVALYYEDNMSTLSSVIEADGRFVSCHTTEGYCGEYIAEIQQDNDIILTGTVILRYIYCKW
ncbi:hypothetical protein D9C73_010120 [Collichthys lucidus]|uniref:Uncharacterized protein n=1 Tax=Collichthys lucidus TaxID=240159 RepID=A0A4U5ULV2_COLLU|nr:hypothetical protein D9C73_010120 [Collichthys lucidus]